jgi:hypothetical protein
MDPHAVNLKEIHSDEPPSSTIAGFVVPPESDIAGLAIIAEISLG